MPPKRLLTAIILFPALLAAQEPARLTLREALRRTAERNVESLAADERVAQAAARMDPARAALKPQLSAGVSAVRQTRNLEAMGIPIPRGQDPLTPPFSTYDARLRLTQTLFDPAAFRRLESARRGRSLAEADRARARQDLLLLGGLSYIEARRTEEAFSLAQEAVALAQAKAALARERASAGTATALDADQAGQAVVQAQAREISSRLDRDQALRDLLGTLSLPEGTPVAFGDDPVPAEETAAPRENPDLRFAEAQRDARRADLAAARGENVPKASVTADYGAIGKSPSALKETYTLGAQANWAFFDGGQRRGRQEELAAQAREAETRVEDAARRQDLKLAQADQSAKAARLLLEAREADLRLAERQEALARERRGQGAAADIDVKDAAFARARARDDREEALSLLWTAELSRRRALGQMEELLK
jgi:outer membrane protein TolC